MKYFFYFFIYFSLTACNSLADGSEEAEQVISFSINSATVSVHPHNFEASQTCPKVYLLDANDRTLDRTSLCQVDIDGYPPFEAHSDFAFIQFENYRIDEQALIYDVDLALIRGGAFLVRCRLPIQESTLGTPACQKLDDEP